MVVGKSDGMVDIVDPNSNQVVRSFQAHGGIISDMDAKETTLLTCGFSHRKTGLLLDPHVNIYDLRAGKSLPPVPFPAGAGFVCLHPKLSTCAFIASQTGQIQLIDFANAASTQIRLHQASLSSTGILSGLDISPSGDFLALADGPYIQLWDNHHQENDESLPSSTFNEFCAPTDFPVDPSVYTSSQVSSIVPPQPTYFDIDDFDTPLSSIGLPYYKEELVSSWAVEPGMRMVFDVGMPQQRIPVEVLLQVQQAATAIASGTSTSAVLDIQPTDSSHGGVGLMGYLPPLLPHSTSNDTPPNTTDNKNGNDIPSYRRNIGQKYVSFKEFKRNNYSSGPKFISERNPGDSSTLHNNGSGVGGDIGGGVGAGANNNSHNNNDSDSKDKSNGLKSSSSSNSKTLSPDTISPEYRKLEIKYSKFGISDFDFEYYNHTFYSGLEPQFVNSYCNPLLQLCRYSQPLFEFALNNLRHNTLDDKSLLSELGLLFDMLHKAQGRHCAATNFVKTLSAIPQANALGLIIDDAHPLHSLSTAVTSVTGGIIPGSSTISNIGGGLSGAGANAGYQFNSAATSRGNTSSSNPGNGLENHVTASGSSSSGGGVGGAGGGGGGNGSSNTNSATAGVGINGSNAFATLYGRTFGMPSSFLRSLGVNSSGNIANGNSCLHAQGLLLQAFSRFLMERIAIDERAYDKESKTFDKIAGFNTTTIAKYPSCGKRTSRQNVVYSLELNPLSITQKKKVTETLVTQTPFKSTKKNHGHTQKFQLGNDQANDSDSDLDGLFSDGEDDSGLSPNVDTTSTDSFLAILQNSIEKTTTTRGWCESCHKYQTLTTTKTVEKLPEILNLHIPLNISYSSSPSQTTASSSTASHPSTQSFVPTNLGQNVTTGTNSSQIPPDYPNPPSTGLFIPQQGHYQPNNQQQHSHYNLSLGYQSQSGQTLTSLPNSYAHPQSSNSVYQKSAINNSVFASPFIPQQAQQSQVPQHSSTTSHGQSSQEPPEENKPFWRKKEWPATYFAVQKTPIEANPLENSSSNSTGNKAAANSERYNLRVIPAHERKDEDDLYELIGFVVEVNDAGGQSSDNANIPGSSTVPGPGRMMGSGNFGSDQGSEDGSHLIAFINIPIETEQDDYDIDIITKTMAPPKQWHLFNDFLVKPVSRSEALNFTYSWKTPVVVMYQKIDTSNTTTTTTTHHSFDVEKWRSELDTSILYRDHFAAGIRASFKKEYELLDPESEVPEPGTLVAIDAEFVLLQHEETEIISNGTKSLLRPKELSLARVSVVRGQGPKEGVPFIDDFIATTETIVDYLTEYSGIEPGDLDPWTSKRGGLVTLQTSYKRLWLLLNLGCVFIGHGLYNDFRTINIQIPSSQVVDTFHLFYLPEYKRRLSLKFLAYALLKENVQTGNHDSIEDAVTALRLFKEYQKTMAKGPHAFTSLLHRLYSDGKKCNFKPPPPPPSSQSQAQLATGKTSSNIQQQQQAISSDQ